MTEKDKPTAKDQRQIELRSRISTISSRGTAFGVIAICVSLGLGEISRFLPAGSGFTSSLASLTMVACVVLLTVLLFKRLSAEHELHELDDQ